uniref:Uncharacterized protein n=1 Tax=Rhizophora mucronata TaxID=61149 RepID=A0A2P2LLN1_RHIMU
MQQPSDKSSMLNHPSLLKSDKCISQNHTILYLKSELDNKKILVRLIFRHYFCKKKLGYNNVDRMTDAILNIAALVNYYPSLLFLNFQSPLSKWLPIAYGECNVLTDIVSHSLKSITQ